MFRCCTNYPSPSSTTRFARLASLAQNYDLTELDCRYDCGIDQKGISDLKVLKKSSIYLHRI